MIGGFDVYIYGEVYEISTIRMFLYPNFEWGFKLYYWVLKLCSDRREFMFFISAIVFIGGHSYVIKKWSPLVYFSLFVYFSKFFFYSFVYVRQGIAMFIAWYSIKYLFSNERAKFALALLVIFFFHKSAIIFAPLLIIHKWKFNNWQLALLTVTVVVLGISPLGKSLVGMVASTSGDEKLHRYLEKSGGINFFYVIETAMLTVLAVVFRKDFYKEQHTTIIYNGFLSFIYVIIISLTNASFIRLGWYYYIFMALALAHIYFFIKSKQSRLLYKSVVFIYFSLIFFRQMITLTAGDLIPYKSIFQDFDRNGDSEHYEYRKE